MATFRGSNSFHMRRISGAALTQRLLQLCTMLMEKKTPPQKARGGGGGGVWYQRRELL